mmetsp:Transcript_8884/g.13259  ORF Transcript_8884/g.13259 Transcript_8884/m.13259 type:complete len:1469 (+) Transcript_8884:1-4407(+)
MGNRGYTAGGGNAIEVHDYVRALNQRFGYQFLEKLPGGKVVKTCLCTYKERDKFILAVYAKQENGEEAKRIKNLVAELGNINAKINLLTHPGVMSSKLIDETKEAFYFSKQYIAFNIFERFHHRPFFSSIDKLWIAYQLLQAVMQLHKSSICHGGLKCENILVTTWNWLFVTDMSFYKPTFLPADNPSTYNYFFDAEKQRTTHPCYLAPERFYESKEGVGLNTKLTPQMDIFSLGCCLAEIFLEGTVIFDYSQMLRYRTGDYDPDQFLSKINNPHAKALISHMLNVDPKKRLSAAQYIGEATCDEKTTRLSNLVFPKYFKQLYHLLKALLDPSFSDPDRKIFYLHSRLGSLLHLIVGESEPSEEDDITAKARSRQSSTLESKRERLDCNTVIEKMKQFVAGIDNPANIKEGSSSVSKANSSKSTKKVKSIELKVKGKVDTSTLSQDKKQDDNNKVARSLSGLSIIVSIVGACIQDLQSPQTKLNALEILEAVALKTNDSSILDLVIPHAVFLRNDEHAMVRYKVVQILALALDKVSSISSMEINVFHDYILPIISKLHPEHEKDSMVQIGICRLIPVFMRLSRRFLDMSHRLRPAIELKTSGDKSPSKESKVRYYDKDLETIKKHFLKIVVAFLAQGSSKAKIALLKNFLPVCEFLGKRTVEEHMVVHLTTILNEADWELRASMFRHLPSFSDFLGDGSFVVDFLLPIMTEALYDSELFVSHHALKALTKLCFNLFKTESDSEKTLAMGRRNRKSDKELIEKVLPLLLNPSTFIREEACRFMVTLAEALGPARTYTLINPVISKYLTQDLLLISKLTLAEALRPAIPRKVYEATFSLYENTRTNAHLKVIDYFKDLSGELQEDLHAYFKKVVAKSGFHNNSARRSMMDSPVSSNRMEYPGRNAKVYATHLEPIDDERKRRSAHAGLDAKRQRERKRGLDVVDSSTVGEQPPPEGAMEVVKNAFDIPLLSADYKPIEANASERWFRRRVRKSRIIEEKGRVELSSSGWCPKGILIAEAFHKGSVNAIEVSADSRWIASGSSDGSVKIWDVSKLSQPKESFTTLPELNYDKVGGVVRSITICGTTSRVAAVSDNGSVHVFNVDAGQNFKMKHARCLVKESNSAITSVTHADTLSKSLLLYGTHTGLARCWDFRRDKEAFTLDLSKFGPELGVKSFGCTTATTVGPSGYTYFVGTSQGYIILWDLRHQSPTSIWRHSSNSKITCLAVASEDAINAKYQTNTRSPTLIVSIKGTEELSVFCVLTGICRAIFKIVGSSTILANSGNWTRIKMSGLKKKGTLGRSTIVNHLSLPSLRVFNLRNTSTGEKFAAEFSTTSTTSMLKEYRGVNAFLIEEKKGLLTAGRDRIIRYWNLNRIERSHRLTRDYLGPYRTKFSMREENATVIFEEQLLKELDAPVIVRSPERKKRMKLPKGSSSSFTQKIHESQITDMKAVNYGEGLLASCDSTGVIKIWR